MLNAWVAPKNLRGGAGEVAWQELLNLDITQAANQTMTAAGSYSALGFTWWAKGALAGTTTVDFVNGSGIRFLNPPDAPLTWRWQGFTTYAGRLVFFPFAQLSGWNPDLPSLVTMRITGALSNNSSRAVIAGVGGMADAAAAITATEKAASFSWSQFLPWAPNTNFVCQGGAQGNQQASGNASGALGDYQLGMLRPLAGAMVPCGRPYAGTMEDPSADFMSSQGPNTSRGFYNSGSGGAAEQPNLGAFFAMHHTSADGITLDFSWANLAVFQPGV